MGSASVFLAAQPKNKSYLYDTVESLVATFNVIKHNPMAIHPHLKILSQSENTQRAYNEHRSNFNKMLDKQLFSPAFAALFLYLNHNGYNGLWRQNKNGEYNVPFGDYNRVRVPSISDLIATSKSFQNAYIRTIGLPNETFNVIRRAESGDVIFADPPYLNTYQGYDGLFEVGIDYQQELAISLWRAARHGVKVIATNVDCKETRSWYGAFCKIKRIVRSQSIAGTNQGRKKWNQILAISK